MSNTDGFKIQPVDFLRTEHQVGKHEGFASGVLRVPDRNYASETKAHTMRLAMPPSWTEKAKCMDDYREYDEHVSANKRETQQDRAERLCAGCPVLSECLEAAMLDEAGKNCHNQRHGIRGGLVPNARMHLALERMADADGDVA